MIGFVSTYFLPFLVVLTILVFVHELGHFLAGRWAGVRIEAFSIGFGPEIFGWYDRHGTRWRMAWLPFGGYVKFEGEEVFAAEGESEGVRRDEAPSAPGFATAEPVIRRAGAGAHGPDADILPPVERPGRTFGETALWRRAIIVAAGPVANFVFAIAVLAGLTMTYGEAYSPPLVKGVQAGSAAEEAGLVPGDRITAVDGRAIDTFQALQRAVIQNTGTPITLDVQRDGRVLTLALTPRMQEVETPLGGTQKVARIGLSAGVERRERGVIDSVVSGVAETWHIVEMTGNAIGQMIVGTRSTEDLSGPIGIGQMSGQMASEGIPTFIWFLAVFSINLGLINLVPVPMLDGGHLLFYAFEAVRGRPLALRVQEIGFRVGLVMVLTLMVFATWNDLVRLRVVDFVSGVFS